VKNAQKLPADQFRDLLKLRGEIGQLRLAEQQQLQKTNAQSESQKQLAEAQAAPNYWPKERLAFAGYASPESALKSMLWAIREFVQKKIGDEWKFHNLLVSGQEEAPDSQGAAPRQP